MKFDFASGLTSTDEEVIIDPEEIFRRQASGKNLWIGQGDILRAWHEKRDKNDILITMDTGMGKTIVGLLIAHSIMNKKNKKVVYLCASKQLVEQTVQEASDLGIKTVSYTLGKYSTNEFDFHECRAPLVTTYQALFNGKSKFTREDIGGIVFDDSHVSGNVLRDSFTLSISMEDSLYTKIASLFKSYFDSVGKDVRYKNILENKGEEVFILPPFEVRNNIESIKEFFLESKVGENRDYLFSWEYLKDNLDMCLFIINAKRLEIVPPVIPSKTLSFFKDNVSRVYLSATHVGMDYFPRYYGNKINDFISFPSGKSKSKKFIISPHKTNINIDDTQKLRKLVLDAVSRYRTLIITPSFSQGNIWKKLDDENIIEAKSTNILEAMEGFKKSENKKLVLANRYDGIDFPNDSCRVLIFDGLPTEGELLSKYFFTQLKADNYIRSEVNAKILQGIGRIFRGTDDFGIVILLGKDEVKWISTPKNIADFPESMQVHLEVGNKLNKQINKENFSELINQILVKDTELMNAYDRFIDEETKKIDVSSDELKKNEKILMEKISLIESHLYSKLWERDSSEIEVLCTELTSASKDLDITTNAWHYFISAMALSSIGKTDKSNYFYAKAYSLEKVLPQPIVKNTREFTKSEYGLVNFLIECVENFDKEEKIKSLTNELDYLNKEKYRNEDKKHELGIELLGKCLGFKTERPDNKYKTGPDVFWELPNSKCVILELKTNKTTGKYSKKEIAQSLDHVEWVKQNKEFKSNNDICKIIIGLPNEVNNDSNPSEDMWIIKLEEFYNYANKIIQALELCYSPTFTTTKQVEQLVSDQGLDWNNTFNAMIKVLAVDLKK